MQTAIFAGGCFWCLDAAFRMLKGVETVDSGYIGGTKPNPSYEAVCNGNTGHAEAIRIVFDKSIITYKDLLTVFFGFHDPTTLNRQGNDVGTQYRSAIFPIDSEQEAEARAMVNQLTTDETFGKPIVTTIETGHEFFPAEGYHQDYYRKNPDQGYCAAVISPKLAKLRQYYASLLKT
jgi:peptide-methionine (S)-S-oxide reductase